MPSATPPRLYGLETKPELGEAAEIIIKQALVLGGSHSPDLG